MFHSSSIHHFDTMFVILCVIAGATSHFISNSSKTTPNYKLHNRYKSSFIDLLLDTSLLEFIESTGFVNNQPGPPPDERRQPRVQDVQSTMVIDDQEIYNARAQIYNILSGNQIKFCQRHYSILEAILPQVVQLTRSECARITRDLRWNCTTLDIFLDRSNSLSFTREAALVRSILNASMMYLTMKTCIDHRHYSCGCQSNQEYIQKFTMPSRSRQEEEMVLVEPSAAQFPIGQVGLNLNELKSLETGSPLRLTRSMIRHQGCILNIAFADAFTRIFMDAEDTRSLNKAYRILNDSQSLNRNNHRNLSKKRHIDTDYRDLSFIKWTKSALNLHNNHIGRQAVREATQKQCRCHGISGTCQFRTCWDHLLDFEVVSDKLRAYYMDKSRLAEVRNLGTHSNPDLYLATSAVFTSPSTDTKTAFESQSIDPSSMSSTVIIDRVQPNELAYLYDSPDFCKAQPHIQHLGTRGRHCFKKVAGNSNFTKNFPTKIAPMGGQLVNESAPGTCEYLCCNRGFDSKLILEIVECNCRFRFCCKVECDSCLRQRMQHFCR